MDIQRHRTIVDMLARQPFLSVNELVEVIGVSPATVRRDIDKLVESGVGQKVHGGIAALHAPIQNRTVARPFNDNRDILVGAKKAIAREAVKLVADGSAIIVHGGSTCFHFGVEIAKRNLRVFTQSMPLASYLYEHSDCHLMMGGGMLHREPGILFDPKHGEYPFYASQFFVGALGIGALGLLESNPLLVRLTREMSELATEVIVLVDSRKFAERPNTIALPWNRVARLVTDDGLSDRDAKMLDNEGVDYLIAKTTGDCAL